MTELTTEQADLDRARDRLAALLEYVIHMVRLGERTVFSIEQHRNLVLYEHEFHDRVGIQHDLDDGESWIKIERLRRLDPPEVPESLRPWCQGRSKIRPRWRRKTRPAGHWTECLKAAVRGKASGPRGGRVLAGVLAVCEAIAVAVQLQDVDVMGESVEECTG